MKNKEYRNLIKEYIKIRTKILKIKPFFDESLKKIASKNHASALIVPIKSKNRIIEKAIVEYGGDITKVNDILRGSIISRVYDRIPNILEDIKENFEVVRIKNRFEKPGPDGYRDVLINIRIKDVIAEIQLHVKALFEIKEYISHLFYNVIRIIWAEAKKGNRNLFSWEENTIKKINEIQKYANEQAWHRQMASERGEDPTKMIFLVTHNLRKFKEAKSLIPTLKLIKIDLPEIQSNNLKKIVREKIKKALDYVDGKIIVEDIALYCEGLKGMPGPFHRFLSEKMSIKDLAKIVISTKNTKAKAVSMICFAEGPSKFCFFEGAIEGNIVLPRGKNGFDWDPIFQPKGYKETFAEMSSKIKNKISMRRKAFDKLIDFLHKKYDISV